MGRFYLHFRPIDTPQEGKETRNQVGVDHSLNRRVLGEGQKSAHTNSCEKLLLLIGVVNENEELLEVGELIVSRSYLEAYAHGEVDEGVRRHLHLLLESILDGNDQELSVCGLLL